MNKLGMVLGLAAVATLAGCKDPDYRHENVQTSQTEVKNIDTTAAKPIVIEPVATHKCTCPPGMRHTSPCTCGDPNCLCIVETKPIAVVDVPKAPAEAETTVYVVQRGDYLAKISKKFNVTISSIKRLNPSIKKDVVRVGQKLKIPGKFDTAVQSAPAVVASATPAAKKPAKKAYQPYAGATKDYVVKNGDTLGSIAYGNGINIRQLKELNGLATDSLKIGQKLRVPAEKVAKAAKGAAASAAKPAASAAKSAASAAKSAASAAKPAAQAKKAVAVQASEANAPVAEQPVEEVKAVTSEAAPAAEATEPASDSAEAPKPEAPATTTYVVQDGDDMTSVSIRWGVSAAEIRDLNNLAEGDQLVPGQIIKLPADAQQ